jgi:hypothetical protein
MEDFEEELMTIFNCDPSWPICLFDFTYKNKVPHYFCFKVNRSLNDHVIPDYFIPENAQTYKDPKSRKLQNAINENDILAERNPHLCNCSD